MEICNFRNLELQHFETLGFCNISIPEIWNLKFWVLKLEYLKILKFWVTIVRRNSGFLKLKYFLNSNILEFSYLEFYLEHFETFSNFWSFTFFKIIFNFLIFKPFDTCNYDINNFCHIEISNNSLHFLLSHIFGQMAIKIGGKYEGKYDTCAKMQQFLREWFLTGHKER